MAAETDWLQILARSVTGVTSSRDHAIVPFAPFTPAGRHRFGVTLKLSNRISTAE